MIYSPSEIQVGKHYKSSMESLYGVVYMGTITHPKKTKGLVIIQHLEDFEDHVGKMVTDDLDAPIWENGFELIG